MKNLLKFLSIGVFAASTTLVAHATTMVSGSIQFSDDCGSSCGVTIVPSNGSGYLQFVPGGTVTGPSAPVNGVDTLTYFDESPYGAVTFYNTNLSNGNIANVGSGVETVFGPACNVGPCGYNTSPNQAGAPLGGALIASIDENDEILKFYVTTEETVIAISSLNFVDLIGTGYFTETCDAIGTAGVNCVNYAPAQATFQINTGDVGEITIQGSASTIAATPEPSGLILLGTGLASAAGMVFRRRRSSIA